MPQSFDAINEAFGRKPKWRRIEDAKERRSKKILEKREEMVDSIRMMQDDSKEDFDEDLFASLWDENTDSKPEQGKSYAPSTATSINDNDHDEDDQKDTATTPSKKSKKSEWPKTCEICGTSLNSQMNWDLHLTGKRHQSALKTGKIPKKRLRMKKKRKREETENDEESKSELEPPKRKRVKRQKTEKEKDVNDDEYVDEGLMIQTVHANPNRTEPDHSEASPKSNGTSKSKEDQEFDENTFSELWDKPKSTDQSKVEGDESQKKAPPKRTQSERLFLLAMLRKHDLSLVFMKIFEIQCISYFHDSVI